MRTRVRRTFGRAAAAGCTALHDCGIGLTGTNDLALLISVMQDNPPIDTGHAGFHAMDEWEKMGLKPGHGDDRFDGIKAWSDGSNQAYTGYQRANIVGRLEPGEIRRPGNARRRSHDR